MAPINWEWMLAIDKWFPVIQQAQELSMMSRVTVSNVVSAQFNLWSNKLDIELYLIDELNT